MIKLKIQISHNNKNIKKKNRIATFAAAYEDGLYNYSSDCNICKDDDDDNRTIRFDYDKFVGENGNYNNDHDDDVENSGQNKSQQQKYRKEKKIATVDDD